MGAALLCGGICLATGLGVVHGQGMSFRKERECKSRIELCMPHNKNLLVLEVPELGWWSSSQGMGFLSLPRAGSLAGIYPPKPQFPC